MKKLTFLMAILAIASIAQAIDQGVVGKTGQALPVVERPAQPAGQGTRADIVYNTAGTPDAPATTGGSANAWGAFFVTSWTNLTGHDVHVAEFGWPCGGPTNPVAWVVWITAGGMPGAPGTQNYWGAWVPASGDDVTNPPPVYSYIDVSGTGIVVPADMVMYFGYENPGLGGQITANGTETWAWYEGAWDPDSGWGRTAVLQFKGNFVGVASERTSLSSIKALF